MSLTQYTRTKVRKLLTASKTWILTYVKESHPCDLCPLSHRIVTRTEVTASHLKVKDRGCDQVYVCYKCLGRLSLARELHQSMLDREERRIKRNAQREY